MLVVATPCPLLIAIPVAIIGSISLAARRGIIIKDPAVLEKIDTCRTAIFDKTGTLTYGQPQLTEVLPGAGLRRRTKSWRWSPAWSATRSTRWPAPSWRRRAGAGVPLREAGEVSEPPGRGAARDASAGGRSRSPAGKKLVARDPELEAELPAAGGGLECVVLIDGRYAATFRFRDQPRAEGASFIRHLGPRHHFDRVLLVSGRPRVGGALPGRAGRHHGGLRRPDARSRSWRSSAGRRGGRTRSSWATASTTPRP